MLACHTATTQLNYENSVRGALIPNTQEATELSNIIVIATSAEAISPGPGATFPPEMETVLQQVDFNQTLAILILVGQISENGQVKQINRIGTKVQIALESYSVGPGNYVVDGFTENYQLILIEKSGKWHAEIEFVVKAENNTIGEVTHFVP